MTPFQQSVLEAQNALPIREKLSDLIKSGDREQIIDAFEALEKAERSMTALLTTAWKQALKATQPVLSKCDGGLGDTPFQSSWEHFRKNPSSTRLDDIVKTLTTITRTHLVSLDPKTAEETFQTYLNTGTIPYGYYNDLLTNFNDGTPLCLEMKAWQPIVREKTENGYQMPKPGIGGLCFTTELVFPTGNLLVSDSLDILNFREIQSTLKQGLNINYGWQRVAYTQQQARHLNVGMILSSSDAPGVVGNGIMLAGARPQESWEPKANICHDLWAYSIIDRHVLLDILTKVGHTHEAVNTAIDAWLEEKYNTSVTVAAGIWHLTWSDDPATLNQHAKTQHWPENPWFVLTQEQPALPKTIQL